MWVDGPGRFCTRSAQQRQFERDRFSEKTQKLLTKFPGLAASDRHNSAMRTNRRILTAKINLYRTSSFHFYRWNQLKRTFLPSTLRTRTKYPQTFRFCFRGRQNSAMMTDRRKLEAKINLYGMSSFYFHCWNHFKVIPLPSTLRKEKRLGQPVGYPKRIAFDYALCDIFVITRDGVAINYMHTAKRSYQAYLVYN